AGSGRPDGRSDALAMVAVGRRLHERVPLDSTFRDERGQAVRLADYFGRVPVILTLNYYDCPMLCPLALNDLLRAVRALSLDLGTDFEIVTISIDPQDGPARAAEKKQWYVERYGRSHGSSGWREMKPTSKNPS